MSQSCVEEHCNFNSSISISDQHARKKRRRRRKGWHSNRNKDGIKCVIDAISDLCFTTNTITAAILRDVQISHISM